ncbi:hypothetical protein ACH4NT_14605 [Streptomyces lydicus]|uniref:hypothetical protein n=1 Tax=Streptomyces lydicus TaxID=47763 RepID=UPI0037A59B51
MALDRAIDLAQRHLVPSRHASRWRAVRLEIQQFVEITVRTTTAALLVGSDDMQVYVRRMGRVTHALAALAFST